MRTFVIGAFLALLAPVTQAAAGQYVPGRELSLAFHEDGTVDLLARNVTTREILAEWARQCQCHVVNAEQLTGGAMMQPVQFARARTGYPCARAVFQAWRDGRRAAWLPGQDYEALLAEPLDQARRRLRIPRPEIYERVPAEVRNAYRGGKG